MPCTISSVTVEADDATAAEKLYAALGVADRVAVRRAEGPASGFHGFTLSIVTSQPANVDAYLDAAVAHGTTLVKPGRKSLWGYGGSFRAPDGSTWTVASSSKKDSAPAALEDAANAAGTAEAPRPRSGGLQRTAELPGVHPVSVAPVVSRGWTVPK